MCLSNQQKCICRKVLVLSVSSGIISSAASSVGVRAYVCICVYRPVCLCVWSEWLFNSLKFIVVGIIFQYTCWNYLKKLYLAFLFLSIYWLTIRMSADMKLSLKNALPTLENDLLHNIGLCFTQIIFFIFLTYVINTFLIAAYHKHGPTGQPRHLCLRPSKLSSASELVDLI